MPSLSEITASPMLKEFAQGAAQSAVQPVADFLAPTVEVPTSIGRYKIYTEKNRFAPPDTSRAIGGRATVLSFDATDATYNCQPNALDFPIDFLEQIEEAALTNALMEGATIVAEVAALCHEQSVINTAVAATSGTAISKTWSGGSGSDPIDDIDAQILNVIKAARYGSLTAPNAPGPIFDPVEFAVRFRSNTPVASGPGALEAAETALALLHLYRPPDSE